MHSRRYTSIVKKDRGTSLYNYIGLYSRVWIVYSTLTIITYMHNITVLAIDNSSTTRIHTLRARSTTRVRVVSIDACLKCMHTTLLVVYIYI